MVLTSVETQSSDDSAVRDKDSSAHLVLDLILACAKRKKFIVKFTSVAFLGSILFALLSKNVYTGRTRLLPPQQNQSLNSALLSQLAPLAGLAGAGSGLQLKSPNEMYLSMLQSDTVFNAVIRRFHLMELFRDDYLSDARIDLQKRTRFAIAKDGIISIEYDDNDPKRAADVANAFVEELQRLTQNLAITEAGKRRLFFEQQVVAAKEQLSEAEVALRRTQEKTGLIQAEGQARAMIEAVTTLQAHIAAKEVQLNSMRTYGTEENPDVVRAEKELAALRVQMNKLQKEGDKGGLELPVKGVPEAGLEYLRKLRDVKYYESMYELLSKQYEIARIDEAKNAAVIQAMDPALIPDRKSRPFRTLIVLGSTLVGFVLSLVIALVLEHLEKLRNDPEIVAKAGRLNSVLRSTRYPLTRNL